MTNAPSIQVLIPTSGRAGCFAQALRSVCEQTYRDFTVTVLNNGATDRTEDVFHQIRNEYPDRTLSYVKLAEPCRGRTLFEKQKELITARNVVIFRDNDLMCPRYMEYLAKALTERPDLVFVGCKTRECKYPNVLKWKKEKGKYDVGGLRDLVRLAFEEKHLSFGSFCCKAGLYKEADNADLFDDRDNLPFFMDIASHGNIGVFRDKLIQHRLYKTCDDKESPSPEQRLDYIKKAAGILSTGDKKCQKAFYDGLLSVFVPNGYVDFQTAVANGWVRFSKGDFHQKKIYKARLFKYLLYRFLSILLFFKRKKFGEKAKKYAGTLSNDITVSADVSNQIKIVNGSYGPVTVNVTGKNNRIFVFATVGTGRISVNVTGDDNDVFIRKIVTSGPVTVDVFCSNGKVDIQGSEVFGELTVLNGYPEQCSKITGGTVSIGEGANIRSAFIFNPHSNAHVRMGKNCMLSDGISIRNTDGHPVFDRKTNAVLNKVEAGSGIDIGDRVWIGLNATVLKNARIPDDSVVGTQAVVTKRFSENNVVIAGTPARIVKHDIKWALENDGFFNPQEGIS